MRHLKKEEVMTKASGKLSGIFVRIHPDSIDPERVFVEYFDNWVPDLRSLWPEKRGYGCIFTSEQRPANPKGRFASSVATRNGRGEIHTWITWEAIHALGLIFDDSDRWENYPLLRPKTAAEIRVERSRYSRLWRFGYWLKDRFRVQPVPAVSLTF